jgi:hypothetical protein
MGGKRASKGRLGKGRSACQRYYSIASAKWALSLVVLDVAVYASAASSAWASAISVISAVGENPSSAGASTA